MPDKPFKMFNPKGRDLGSSMGMGPSSQETNFKDVPNGFSDDDPAGGKMTSDQAGYMELDGAVKDADCSKVQVDGGVSSDLGCCNEFSPQAQTQQFSCGTCTLVTDAGDQQSADDDSGDRGMDQSSSPDAGANPAAARA